MTYASAPAERGKSASHSGSQYRGGDHQGTCCARFGTRSAPELARVVAALGVRSSRAEDVLQDVYVAASEKSPGGLERRNYAGGSFA